MPGNAEKVKLIRQLNSDMGSVRDNAVQAAMQLRYGVLDWLISVRGKSHTVRMLILSAHQSGIRGAAGKMAELAIGAAEKEQAKKRRKNMSG